MNEFASLLTQLLHARRTTLPKRLIAPGPNAEQFDLIVGAAAHAPDHRQLVPWRFVVIPASARGALGEAFAQALVQRDPGALPDQVQQAREKALRAPLLLMLVVDEVSGGPVIGFSERLISAGCATQNMLLMATALGFGSALTSGKALGSTGLRSLFQLGTHEHAICFISVGTAQRAAPARNRPDPSQYIRHWSPGSVT